MTGEFGDDSRAVEGLSRLCFEGLGSGDMSVCKGLMRDEREVTE